MSALARAPPADVVGQGAPAAGRAGHGRRGLRALPPARAGLLRHHRRGEPATPAARSGPGGTVPASRSTRAACPTASPGTWPSPGATSARAAILATWDRRQKPASRWRLPARPSTRRSGARGRIRDEGADRAVAADAVREALAVGQQRLHAGHGHPRPRPARGPGQAGDRVGPGLAGIAPRGAVEIVVAWAYAPSAVDLADHHARRRRLRVRRSDRPAPAGSSSRRRAPSRAGWSSALSIDSASSRARETKWRGAPSRRSGSGRASISTIRPCRVDRRRRSPAGSARSSGPGSATTGSPPSAPRPWRPQVQPFDRLGRGVFGVADDHAVRPPAGDARAAVRRAAGHGRRDRSPPGARTGPWSGPAGPAAGGRSACPAAGLVAVEPEQHLEGHLRPLRHRLQLGQVLGVHPRRGLQVGRVLRPQVVLADTLLAAAGQGRSDHALDLRRWRSPIARPSARATPRTDEDGKVCPGRWLCHRGGRPASA